MGPRRALRSVGTAEDSQKRWLQQRFGAAPLQAALEQMSRFRDSRRQECGAGVSRSFFHGLASWWLSRGDSTPAGHSPASFISSVSLLFLDPGQAAVWPPKGSSPALDLGSVTCWLPDLELKSIPGSMGSMLTNTSLLGDCNDLKKKKKKAAHVLCPVGPTGSNY